MLDVLAEEGLGSLLHLDEHHGGDLLGAKLLPFSLVLHLDVGLVAILANHFEWPVLKVLLDSRIVHLPADEALRVKDSIVRVHRGLVLGRVSYQALRLGERDPRRRGSVALVISDDLDALVLPDAHARVGSSQVDSDRGSVNLLGRHDWILDCVSH
mmetsp:Transcript_17606/g.48812  ORF Transcript_17606/g.48812 Transcript_17606/m.48812 type:complete len:156 (+) Transcript_17606:273-740(+)